MELAHIAHFRDSRSKALWPAHPRDHNAFGVSDLVMIGAAWSLTKSSGG